MEISTKVKERFCKDCNIPIRLFKEPYFTDRLKLYDPFYNTMEKWELFTKELQKYQCEQDYFEEYNRVKDDAIRFIQETPAYQCFNNEDMSRYLVTHKGLPNKDIFHPSNDGRQFVSIDMRKANFSSLKCYSPDIFGGAKSWEEFVGKFTDSEHIKNSKYIRQVILGNCNPKRHITYEKYLMDCALKRLENVVSLDNVVFLSNDEIVVDITDIPDMNQNLLTNQIEEVANTMSFPLKVEEFTLHKIGGTDGYYKDITGKETVEFKCLDNYMLPFVIRAMNNETVQDSDRVFYHEGLLAQFVEVPEITFSKEPVKNMSRKLVPADYSEEEFAKQSLANYSEEEFTGPCPANYSPEEFAEWLDDLDICN